MSLNANVHTTCAKPHSIPYLCRTPYACLHRPLGNVASIHLHSDTGKILFNKNPRHLNAHRTYTLLQLHRPSWESLTIPTFHADQGGDKESQFRDICRNMSSIPSPSLSLPYWKSRTPAPYTRFSLSSNACREKSKVNKINTSIAAARQHTQATYQHIHGFFPLK